MRGGVTVFQEYEAKLLLNGLALISGAKLPKKWTIRVQKDMYGFSRKLKEDSTDWHRSVKALTTFLIKRPPAAMPDDEVDDRTADGRYRRLGCLLGHGNSPFRVLCSRIGAN